MTIDRASLPILPIYARWPCHAALALADYVLDTWASTLRCGRIVEQVIKWQVDDPWAAPEETIEALTNRPVWALFVRGLMDCPDLREDLDRLTNQLDIERAWIAQSEAAKSLTIPKSKNREPATAEERAIGILTRHPGWSNEQVAEAARCHVKTLSKGKAPLFAAARRELADSGRRELPGGQKPRGDEEGDIESWDNEG